MYFLTQLYFRQWKNRCKEAREKIYLLSGNSDFEGIANTNIIRVAKLKNLLGQINEHHQTQGNTLFTDIYNLHLDVSVPILLTNLRFLKSS